MNQVSACCHKEIIVRTYLEFPLGGNRWSMSYKADTCSGCGNEIYEYVEACEECGDVGCDCGKKLIWEAKERYEHENFGLPF